MLPTFLLLHRLVTRRRNLRKTMKTAKNDDGKLDTECCRTCLATEGLVDIFNSKECEVKRSEDLKLVTGLEIKLNDGLPQKICSRCVEVMQSALQLRKTSRKSEKTLLNLIYGKKKKFKSKPTSCRSVKAVKNVNNVKNVKHVKNVGNVKTLHNKIVNTKDRIKIEDNNIITDYGEGIFDDADNYLYDAEETTTGEEAKQQPISAGRRQQDEIPNAPFYKCNTCGKEFRMKTTYKAHMRFHTNYCICETCGKRCRNNNQLQEHKRARHGLGRIHKCAYCDYSSATKEALTIHERRHTGERPYVCDHCGATFHRRSNLVQHIAIHLPEKNFQCDLCPKRLKSRKFLQIHKHNAHTGKRYGYVCGVCDHRFEKPNKCSICLKREKSRKLLQVHTFKCHRENRYRYLCSVCEQSFARPENVRRHMTRAHHVPREGQGRIERWSAVTSGSGYIIVPNGRPSSLIT